MTPSSASAGLIATTLRRSLVVVLLSSTAARAEAPAVLDEVEVVREALAGPVLRAEQDAARARARASATAGPWLPNPALEARHEQANGPAGASVDYLGGSLTLDLGLAGVPRQAASAMREQAGERWLRAEAVQAVCALRLGSLDLWRATTRVAVGEAAQERAESLVRGVEAQAAAGESAGYERDRAALAAMTHRVQVEAWLHDALRAASALSGVTGQTLERVTLLPLARAGSLDAHLAIALENDPVSAALRWERDAATRETAAARRAGVPDLMVAGGARWDAFPDGSERAPGFEVGAALALPLFDWGQVETRGALAEVASLDARLARRAADLHAAVTAAWRSVDSLGPVADPPPSEALWTGARARYDAGEASIDELLTVARDVEAAELARIEAEALRRRARLDLACAAGRFPEPEIQALLEEIRP